MNRLAGRMLLVGRRTTAAPDGPYAAAVALGLLATIEVVQRGGLSPTALSSSLLLGLLATTPLAVARTHDVAAAGTITAATFLTLASGQRPTAAGLLAQVVILGLVGFRRPVWVAALFATPFAVYAAVPAGSVGPPFRLLLLLASAGALGIGLIRRSGDDAVARAAGSQAAEEELLDHLARGERARIARELHDVVAHHISMIAVQAEAARLTTPGMPREGAVRLRAIGDTARQALTEMRRLLGVLREDAGPTATRAPQPGLEQLNDLVDKARDATAGSTRLIVSGAVAALDPGIELTAYRLVQEALTNARRHAPGAAVDVELHYAPTALQLRVRDNGPGGPASERPPGHGLLGMRERAAAVGGTFSASTATPTGFVVEATLPTGNR